MTLLRGVVTGLAVLLLMTACSGSEADEPGSAVAREAELASVTRDRDRLQQDVRRVETELASVSAERDELRTGLDVAGAKRDRLQQDVRVLKEELAHVSAERDELDRRLASVSAKRDELEGSLASVSSERDGLGLRLAAVEAERDELLAQRREQDVRITDLESELQRTSALSQEAQEQVQYLLSKYDEEIRADLQAAIDGEIDRACAVASAPETYEMPVADIVSWQSDWEPITTRADLENAVEDCAAPERKRLAQQRKNQLQAAVDAEIERACAAAIEAYHEPIGSFLQWDPEWQSVITRLQQIEAVEECAKPERTRRITAELQAAVDQEIERACNAAIEQYRQPIDSLVRWHFTWSSIVTGPQLIEAVEECAGPERDRSIRAELQAAVDEEVERACAVASRRFEESVASIVRWDSGWEEVTTRTRVERAVERCAESERKRLAEERRAELRTEVDEEIERACLALSEERRETASSVVRWDSEWEEVTSRERLENSVKDCADKRVAEVLADCQRIDVDQLQKNPDGLAGTCLVTYAYIVQYDSATGPCSFHAELSRSRSTRWYDYDVRSTFGYSDNEVASSFVTNCPELDRIDTEDYIKVWATVLGSFSYETTMGGTNHVPSFRIEKIELVQKN